MGFLVSIIIPVLNRQAGLERTLASVFAQRGDFECLVMDGGSADGTLEFLQGIKDCRLRYFSGRDGGIYEAMNKGIKLAKGRFLYFLGAGDVLLPGALEALGPHLKLQGPCVVYGDAILQGEIYDGEFDSLKLCRENICHQALFCSREVFDLVGCFETRYRSFADWAWNFRWFGNSAVTRKFIPVLVAKFEDGGVSGCGDEIFERDKSRLIRRHLGIAIYLKFYWPQWMEPFWRAVEGPKEWVKARVPLDVLVAKRRIFGPYPPR
jgi:glycosyltransferase involved in cell wall biosynthesis